MEPEKKHIICDFEEIQLKEEGDEAGIFSGYGSTFGGKPDSYGDIIDAGAFQESLESGGRNGTGVAMLWSHDSDRPIGRWLELSENKKGLKTYGQLAMKATDGKDMYELMRVKAIQGLSIGFSVIDYERNNETGIRHLKKLNLWEISPVVFPANTRATITSVKDALEKASNEKELEAALREAGLSKSSAKYITGMLKHRLFRRDAKNDEELKAYLAELRKVNQLIGGQNG